MRDFLLCQDSLYVPQPSHLKPRAVEKSSGFYWTTGDTLIATMPRLDGRRSKLPTPQEKAAQTRERKKQDAEQRRLEEEQQPEYTNNQPTYDIPT